MERGLKRTVSSPDGWAKEFSAVIFCMCNKYLPQKPSGTEFNLLEINSLNLLLE
jgi:hypothetical protein